MKYVVLFPECRNVHLVKDVGMIPYYMNKLYGWDASVACYKNEEDYSYLESEVKGLKLDIISKTFCNARLDGLKYLAANARQIDILQIYHIHSSRNYYWIELYKRLNPNGKVYWRLDTGYGLVGSNPFGNFIMSFFRKGILKKCTLISAETESTSQGLTDDWKVCKVEYVANGFYNYGKKKVKYEDKENIICTVGRIGTYQKNTEVLLQAYRLFEKECPEWKLRIIGPVENKFNEYIKKFMDANPHLKNKVIFTGEIKNRDELYNEYMKAKIFCMTSRWEGFSVAYMEALYGGGYIISSDVYSAFDATDYGRLGCIFSIGDYIGLYKCLLRVCKEGFLSQKRCDEAVDFVLSNYNWEQTVARIHDLLIEE